MKKIFFLFLLLTLLTGTVSCTTSINQTPDPGQPVKPTKSANLPSEPTKSVDLPTDFPAPPDEGIQSISSNKERQVSEAIPAEFAPIAHQMNAFGLDLYHLLSEDASANLFFSPYSISLALSMTFAGAAGKTEQEMAQVLHYDLPQNQIHTQINGLDQSLYVLPDWLKDQETSFKLNVANALWGQEDYAFKSTFLDSLAESYGAGLKLVDFKTATEPSRQLINQWVEEQTEDKIKDLIPPGALNEFTRLVLTNAIYFNASWRDEFNPDLTSPSDFYIDEKSTVSVPMMEIQNNYNFKLTSDFQMVEIPYLNSRFSMILMMPISGDFSEFSNEMDFDLLMKSMDTFNRSQVILRMPKFKYESSFSVSQKLQNLGMISAFSPSDADFSGMYEVGEEPLFISDVIHKAFVAVDEVGTEAAAATAVIMEETTSMPVEEPVELVFDHPFIFLIRDTESGLILFMGNVLNPES